MVNAENADLQKRIETNARRWAARLVRELPDDKDFALHVLDIVRGLVIWLHSHDQVATPSLRQSDLNTVVFSSPDGDPMEYTGPSGGGSWRNLRTGEVIKECNDA